MIRTPLTFFLIGKDITETMNDIRIGSLVRLIKAPNSKSIEPEVRVYICGDMGVLTSKNLPVNSVGMVIEKTPNNVVYKVLFGDKLAMISDTYLKEYDPDEKLFIDYANYEGYFPDMESTE